MTRSLRDYQAEDVERYWQVDADGRDRQAAVWATGLGKSTFGGSVATTAARRGERVLMLAHRTELLDQLTDACRAIDPGVPVGRVKASAKNTACPITVGMVQTMTRGAATDGRKTWLDALVAHGAHWDRVVYDEVHHATAPSNLRLLQRLGVATGPNASGTPLLGLTATLTRSDARGLGKLLPDESYVTARRGIDWAISHGWLVRPRGKVVVADHLDLKRAKVTAGDYQDGELGEMVRQDVGQIVDAWIEHAVAPAGLYRPTDPWSSHHPTVAFVPTKQAAHELAAEFARRDVPTDVVVGETTAARRGDAAKGTGIYGALAHGRIRVLVGVMVPTEGWDCPPVGCLLQARPTRLEGLYQQMAGRVLRRADPATWPVLLRPKPEALVLDVVGAARGQRLATLVNLLPDAEQDTSALDRYPCEVCGQTRCRCGAGSRDPDGGRRKIEGPAVYEDLDLLLAESAGGAWLTTDAGHPFLVSDLGHDRRVAVIFREQAGTYRVGSLTMRGDPDPQPIGSPNRGLSLDQARTLAEQWCIRRRPYLASKGAHWRTDTRVPTLQAQRRAWRLGVAKALDYTGRELSELMDIIEVSARLDQIFGAGAAGRTA